MFFFRTPSCIRVGLDLTGKYVNVTLLPSRLYHSLGRGTVVREVRRNKNATLAAKVCHSSRLLRVILTGKGRGGENNVDQLLTFWPQLTKSRLRISAQIPAIFFWRSFCPSPLKQTLCLCSEMARLDCFVLRTFQFKTNFIRQCTLFLTLNLL